MPGRTGWSFESSVLNQNILIINSKKGLIQLLVQVQFFLLICTMGMLPNKQFLRTYCVCQHCAVCSQAIEGAESSSYWLILANTGS